MPEAEYSSGGAADGSARAAGSRVNAPGRGQAAPKKFGTFLGVYVPSVLTILGVMMYLRFGWVAGNTGLPLALLIVLLASGITFITGLSASAIATNMRVGVGGEYFMISRSLGLEMGGSIGIPLFLCRTLSLTLYAFGLAESVSFLWPESWGPVPLQGIAAAAIVLITVVAGKSAELSLKLQIPIMIAVVLSLLALAGGVLTGGLTAPEMAPHYERSAPGGFWYVFAVFFPAVTGFTAGIGMSGDLKDPKRSIPRGTIAAVVTGAAVYLLILFLLSVTAKVSGGDLAAIDPEAPPVWTGIALFGFWLIYPGMWGAILSSAFGSALGGPRVLQALASDGLAPKFFARVSRAGQPTAATWLTGAIALGAVALGDLNAVGRWVTIFFLTLYVAVNLAAAAEKLVGDPSFRPTINVPWHVSLAGCAGAVVVMFLISPLACFVAVGLELSLYLVLRRQAFQSSWGDVRAGVWNALARTSLLKLRTVRTDARNWRPHILLFTANPASRMGLVRLANWFNQNRGVVTVCQIVVGDLEEQARGLAARREEMEAALVKERLTAFCEISVVPDFESGILGIVQANGFAGMEANTVMFGWPRDREAMARMLRLMRLFSQIQISTVFTRLDRAEGPAVKRRIDVWWRGKENNGDLMLLLAHLLSLNAEWREARVLVRVIIEEGEDRGAMRRRLTEMIREVRIEARADIITRPANKTVSEVMRESGRGADVVFLGLMLPGPGQEGAYAERLNELVSGFRAAVLVRNAGEFSGELI